VDTSKSFILDRRADRLAGGVGDRGPVVVYGIGLGQAETVEADIGDSVRNDLAGGQSRGDQDIRRVEVIRTNGRTVEHPSDLSPGGVEIFVEVERWVGVRGVPSTTEPLGETRVERMIPLLVCNAEPLLRVGKPPGYR
jgi:hypothetical protein